MSNVCEINKKYLIRLMDELQHNDIVSYSSIANVREDILHYLEHVPSTEEASLLIVAQLQGLIGSVDEEVLINGNFFAGVRKIRRGIDVLIKLRQQKTISKESLTGEEREAAELLEKKALVCVLKLDMDDEVKEYYTLSAMGIQMFNNRDMLKKIREMKPNYKIPLWDIYNSAKKESYYLQAIIINEYMSKMEISDYFTFNFPNYETIIFACVATDDNKSWYCCAPYSIPDDREVSLLREVAEKGDVVDLKIIGYSESAIERLRACMHNDETSIADNTIFYSLEETNDQVG